ncbi:hypothetical protein V6N13_130734 [Hibiscus sabdariffa]
MSGRVNEGCPHSHPHRHPSIRRRYLHPAVAAEAARNETSAAVNADAASGGNAITNEINVALYADLVEEVKGLTDKLNGWVVGEGNASE